jgi:hypothetical protein
MYVDWNWNKKRLKGDISVVLIGDVRDYLIDGV